ncbi:MAG: hypothetical protein ACLP59_05645 [Bryobacteraceae bacterium]
MSMNLNVNFDAIGERTLRNTSRLVNQGMWILFVISAALMIVLRRNSTSPSGPFWILGFAVLGFMALIVLRDFARKAGHRHTENKIVNDVKTFLEREPVADLTARPMTRKLAAVSSVDPADTLVPSKQAGFVELRGAFMRCTPDAEPVVFDAIPSHQSAPKQTEFYAVLMPVRQAA